MKKGARLVHGWYPVSVKLSFRDLDRSDTTRNGFGIYNRYICTLRSRIKLRVICNKKTKRAHFFPNARADAYPLINFIWP